MELETIYRQFTLLAGLDEQAGRQWLPLCEAAILRLRAILAKDADETDVRLTLAAAGEANFHYSLLRGLSAQSVKLGEISVSPQNGAGTESARALRDALLEGAAELIAPAFVLGRVE